jgi:hypothetical protein
MVELHNQSPIYLHGIVLNFTALVRTTLELKLINESSLAANVTASGL